MSYFRDLVNLYLKTMEGNDDLSPGEKVVKNDIIDITKGGEKNNGSRKIINNDQRQ